MPECPHLWSKAKSSEALILALAASLLHGPRHIHLSSNNSYVTNYKFGHRSLSLPPHSNAHEALKYLRCAGLITRHATVYWVYNNYVNNLIGWTWKGSCSKFAKACPATSQIIAVHKFGHRSLLPAPSLPMTHNALRCAGLTHSTVYWVGYANRLTEHWAIK